LTPIPGPFIVLVLPVVAAGLVFLVRRWALPAAILSALVTGALAVLCLRLPLDRSAFVLGQEVAFGRPVVILGRELMLEPASQAWLAFGFVLATMLFLVAGRVSQGHSFFPISLVVLSLYALIALLHSLTLATMLFGVSAALVVFIIRRERSAPVRGAQRYLVVVLLAVPLILGAIWMSDQSALEPARPALARTALLPAALGFGLLLAAVPFSMWLPALTVDAPPLVSAFVLTICQGMAIYLMMAFLNSNPAAGNVPAVPATAQLVGLLMASGGGVMAAVQRDWGRLFGYAALGSLGYFLLAWGTGTSRSLTLALLDMVNRAAAITLMAASLAIVRQRAAVDEFGNLRGVARRLPVATAGLVLGGLALAGFPFTAGFPTHWAVSRAIASGEWAWIDVLPAWSAGLILLAGSVGIVIGVLRGLGAMLGDEPQRQVAHQPRIASALVLLLAGLAIAISLYPQLFLGLAQAMF
jgi:formate hydrogenlyase subunit 3/multisubunit Na+/H+ antiporter MnhD subunit